MNTYGLKPQSDALKLTTMSVKCIGKAQLTGRNMKAYWHLFTLLRFVWFEMIKGAGVIFMAFED